jgi:two-component system, NtrC family, response regulator
MGRVLIIEDDMALRDPISNIVREMGHIPTVFSSHLEASESIRYEVFDVLVMEGALKEASSYGLKVEGYGHELSRNSLIRFILPLILRLSPHPEVIVVTRAGFAAEARYALENSVVDYIQVPFDYRKDWERVFFPEKITDRIETALRQALKIKDNSLPHGLNLDGLVGESQKFRRCVMRLAQAVGSAENVLIQGESGTGKRLFAKKIHENSSAKKGLFVTVNCAAISETIAENEPFGISGRDGKFAKAEGGVLLLYEVERLPLSLQSKLACIIREVTLVQTSEKNQSLSMPRLISTSSQDLFAMTENGTFLKDLYYLISKFFIPLPSLKERRDDIKELVGYHINKVLGSKAVSESKDWAPEFIGCLEDYNWPGNITEMESVLDRALTEAGDEKTLHVYHLPMEIRWGTVFSSASEANEMDQGALDDISSTVSSEGVRTIKADLDAARAEPYPNDGPPQPEGSVLIGTVLDGNQTADRDSSPTLSFYRVGEFWIIGEKGKEAHLKDILGLRCLHFLLSHPGAWLDARTVHNLGKTPEGLSGNPDADVHSGQPVIRWRGTIPAENVTLSQIKQAKKILEEQLQAAKEAAYEDLNERTELIEEIEEKIELCNSQLNDKEGIGDPSTKKAQTAVYKLLARALAKICKDERVSYLEKYLNASTIKTGYKCSYQPLPSDKPIWILHSEKI